MKNKNLFDSKEHKLTSEDFKDIKYTNFHNHSTYSLLDGIGSVEDHIVETHEKGHQGCCITDHGVMNSSLELYDKARNKGLLSGMGYEGDKYPVVIGCELYITNDALYKDKDAKYHHITVLAKNEQGYKNLSYLTSIGSKTDHFYTRPRISMSELFENKEGLIITTGCFISFISQSIFLKKGHLRNYFYKSFEGITDFSEEEIEKFQEFQEKENFEEYMSYIDEDFISFLKEHKDEKIFNNEIFKKMLKFQKGKTATQRKHSERIIRDLFLIFSEKTTEELVKLFKDEFKDDFYVEFHPTDICMKWDRTLLKHVDQGWNPLENVNRELLKISIEHDLKVIICQDSHMPKKEHYDAQNIMIWNSTSGKKGWHFSEAYYIMSIEDMYKKLVGIYPWVSDEQFITWCNNSQEILDKCKDLELNFEPSLPELDYEDHYVNKVPKIIKREIMIDLQEIGLWSEDIKDYIKEHDKLPFMKVLFKSSFEEAITKLTEKMTKQKTKFSDKLLKAEEKHKKQIKIVSDKINLAEKTLKDNLEEMEKNVLLIESEDSELLDKDIKALKKQNQGLSRKNNTLERNIDNLTSKLNTEKSLLQTAKSQNNVSFDFEIDLELYFELLRIDEDINNIDKLGLNLKDFIESFIPYSEYKNNDDFVKFLSTIGSFTEQQNNYLNIYQKYENSSCIDYDEMKNREKENDDLENVLIKMEEFYKDKENDFYIMLYKSRKDIQLRTCLKVIMKNKKIVPKIIHQDKLDLFIEEGSKAQIKKLEAQYNETKDDLFLKQKEKIQSIKKEDFEPSYVNFLINSNEFYEYSIDPMEMLGNKESRDRLVFEINTIQYNGVLKLISYFMLIEDVTNFHFENNYLRGLGRGSGAGSLLAYGLNITDCPPLENGLFFERFLTKERICEVFYDIKEDGLSFDDFLKENGE